MTKGKKICNLLKHIRMRIAEANHIPYHTKECDFKGECRGTCPACENELAYLLRQLELRRKAGKVIAVAGLCASLVTTTSCKDDHQELRIIHQTEIGHTDKEKTRPKTTTIKVQKKDLNNRIVPLAKHYRIGRPAEQDSSSTNNEQTKKTKNPAIGAFDVMGTGVDILGASCMMTITTNGPPVKETKKNNKINYDYGPGSLDTLPGPVVVTDMTE